MAKAKEITKVIDENTVKIKYEKDGNDFYIFRINDLCNIEQIFRQDFIDKCYEAVEVEHLERKAEKLEMYDEGDR